MQLVLSEADASGLKSALNLARERTGVLTKSLPDSTLASRLAHDADQLAGWFGAFDLSPDDGDQQATVVDLVDGLQELLPRCTVTITIPAPPPEPRP